MFFKLSNSTDSNYPNNYQLPNSTFFNCDLGWEQSKHNGYTIFFKGYVLEDISQQELLENITIDPTPKYKGNFFAVVCDESFTVITHSINRCSPLQYNQNKCVTNLQKDLTPVWADTYLQINDQLAVNKTNFKPYTATYETIDYNFGLDQLNNILCNAFESFLTKNTRPLKVFLSGGVDTLTLYSYLKSFTKNFEIVDSEYVKYTHFYLKNKGIIKSHWGYKQMHSWGEIPTVLPTGGCGDEYLLRGPTTLAAIAQHYKIDVLELIKQNPNCYHHKYYLKDKNIKCFDRVDIDTSDKKTVVDWILNNLVNDHQHWHIDNTLFFSPFANISIPNIILNMPKENLQDQILDAQINKDLITMINPDDLKLLAKYKNTNSAADPNYISLMVPESNCTW